MSLPATTTPTIGDITTVAANAPLPPPTSAHPLVPAPFPTSSNPVVLAEHLRQQQRAHAAEVQRLTQRAEAAEARATLAANRIKATSRRYTEQHTGPGTSILMVGGQRFTVPYELIARFNWMRGAVKKALAAVEGGTPTLRDFALVYGVAFGDEESDGEGRTGKRKREESPNDDNEGSDVAE